MKSCPNCRQKVADAKLEAHMLAEIDESYHKETEAFRETERRRFAYEKIFSKK